MKQAWLVAGLLFGDEAKGATVDYLTARHNVRLVVRFNGGAQAAHNVVLPDGRQHTFSMYGSGTLAGAGTFLARHVRVDYRVLWREAEHLAQLGADTRRVWIDERALVVTRFHIAHSLAQAAVHQRGTCGMGVGTAARHAEAHPDDALRAGDLQDEKATRHKLAQIARHFAGTDGVRMDEVRAEADTLRRLAEPFALVNEAGGQAMLHAHDAIIFEGAQGALLHREHGFKPYVTSSDTSFAPAFELLDDRPFERIGCVRCYTTRHGPGPLPTEDESIQVRELHNREDVIQGRFRRGWFDLPLAERGFGIVGGVDSLAVSHLDGWQPTWKVAVGHRADDCPEYVSLTSPDAFLDRLETALATPIGITAHGPRRIDRRG